MNLIVRNVSQIPKTPFNNHSFWLDTNSKQTQAPSAAGYNRWETHWFSACFCYGLVALSMKIALVDHGADYIINA